jgi:signal transduction histidine kinase/FixJ family two-component response regulator
MTPIGPGWQLSFRAKTVLGVALIEFLLLALLVWSSLEFLSKASLNAVAERAANSAAQFATLAKDAVLSEDLASLRTFVDEVMADPDMVYLRVTGYDVPLVERGDQAALTQAFQADTSKQIPNDGVFDAAADVNVDGTTFGRIELGVSMSGEGMLLALARERLLIIALTEILLVALFSILLGTYLTRGLERLRSAAETISEGGPGVTVPVRGNDELAITARAFNRMSEQLLTSYDALNQARRAAEQSAAEAESASQAAQQANAAKSRFLAHMSHELRTPLNAVLGILQLSRDWTLPSEQHQQLLLAEQAGRALHALINDVLDLSKIEAGEMTLREESANVAELVRAAGDIVAPMARAKGLAIELKLDPRLPARMRVDPVRLRQVLVNLAGNAVKFTDSGQVRLSVETHCPGESCQRLRFEVCDTGIGIPEHGQATLFDEFSQVADGAGRQNGGTGLGLSISQRIVNLMGGHIQVESGADTGSRFWFEIVLNADTQQVAVAAPACRTPASVDASALPVLLVDDVPTNTLVAKAMLKKAGYQVQTATNGVEALEAVCNGPLGCILMDLEMPVMGGLEATRRIRALSGPSARVPIIAMTAHALTEEKDRCLAAGMDDFVTKPFAREQLLETLALWHGSQHAPTAAEERSASSPASAAEGVRAG